MKYSKISMIVAFTLVLLSSIVFILVNNDHKECDLQIKSMVRDDGNTVVFEEHICKEKYNF